MKAQRRHELQQSDLAKVIKQAPSFWQDVGGKWLLAAIAVVVIAILIRYRLSSNRQAAAQAMESLAQARLMVNAMERLSVQAALMPPQAAAQQRRQYFNDATTAINDATARSDEKQVAAEALVAKGDLNYAASQIPSLAGSTTQPTLQFRDPKELLASATDAYQGVLNTYGDVSHAAVAARFGLAAIAENRGDFDAARQQYQTIATSAAKDYLAYQQLANARLKILEELRKPLIMAGAATEPAEAAIPTTRDIPNLIAAPTTAAAATQMSAPTAATRQAAVVPPATSHTTTTP